MITVRRISDIPPNTLANKIVRAGKWIKDITDAFSQALDALGNQKVLTLKNEDGSVTHVSIFGESDTAYLVFDQSSLWSIATGGNQYFVQKDDPRIGLIRNGMS
jgi:hypothetical protein